MRSPPLRDGSRLPRYLTSFVGREEELDDIARLLPGDDVRLLTLAGPGGAGKTRLAVEAVNRLAPDTWDDIWFVPLVAVRDAALVLPTVAQALEIQGVTGRDVEAMIVRFLGERRALVVIDNVEHVIDAATGFGRILTTCPRTTVLATSRVALRISGEYLYTIAPLPTPAGDDTDPRRIERVGSVRLFLDRANASGRRLALGNDNAADIASICRRLDGLPLALELAAARCGVLSPAALLTLLDRGTSILSDGPRDAAERHRSMREAIAWSYDLLPDHEKTVFRRLAVFSGGFSLEAAEAVIDLPVNALDAIGSLAAKSLLIPVSSATGDPRFTMLETIREFGVEQLAVKDESRTVRDRHAAYFLQEAIDGEYAWCMFLPDGLHWLNRLVEDQSNMRAALDWLYANDEIPRCLRLAGALGSLWILRGLLDEGQMWLDRLLADPRADDLAIRANGLATLSWISNQQNRMQKAMDLAEEVIAISREVDIPLDAIRGHVLSGVAAMALHQYDMARQRHMESIALMKARDHPDWLRNFVQNGLVSLGFVELMRGSLDAAEARFREAYAYDRERGYEPGTSFIYADAVFAGLSRVARAKGDAIGALRYAQQHLRLTSGYDNRNFALHALADIAGAAAAQGQYVQAARLFGASEALHASHGHDFSETFDVQRAAGLPDPWAREGAPCGTAQRLRDALGPRSIQHLPPGMTRDALDAAWADGRKLSLERAVSEALAVSPGHAPETTDDPLNGLSPREREVLRLVAEGRSNRIIASALSISERTVEHHVSHIFAKLDIDSRAAAAAFAVRKGLP